MSTQNHPLEILSSHATSAQFLAPQIVQTAAKKQPSRTGPVAVLRELEGIAPPHG